MLLVVHLQASEGQQPRERPLHHPTFPNHLEPLSAALRHLHRQPELLFSRCIGGQLGNATNQGDAFIGATNHLDLDSRGGFCPCLKWPACITSVQKKLFDQGGVQIEGVEDELKSLTVIDVGGRHTATEQVAVSIRGYVALAAFDLLVAVVAAIPLFCVVLTLWESPTAAEG